MIRYLLEFLLISLGFNSNRGNSPRNSLQPRVEPRSLRVNPTGLIILVVGMVVFAAILILVFLFTGASTVESGSYYYGMQSII